MECFTLRWATPSGVAPATGRRSGSPRMRGHPARHERLPLVRYSPDRPLGVAPASASDYRELARRKLPRQLFDYVDGGAYADATMRAKVSDLGAVLLRQVVMRDVSVRAQAVEVLGQE